MTPESKTLGEARVVRAELEVDIRAPRARVFEAITKGVQSWWGLPYMRDGGAAAIVMEPRLGGRPYEDWGDGQGSVWATVTSLRRDEWIELTGNVGLFGAVHGVVQIRLADHAGGTRVSLSHRMAGEVDERTHAGYTEGWADLIGGRLKAFVEEGRELGLGHEEARA